MEKVINSYECLFIVNPANGEEAMHAAANKFITLVEENSTETEVTEWGKRRLAYPINDIPDGYYVLVNFKSESAFPSELERRFNIDEAIMRGIVIRLDEKKIEAAKLAAEEAKRAAAEKAEAAATAEAEAQTTDEQA